MKQIAKLKDDARRYELKEEWDRAIDAYLQVLRLSDEGDGADFDLPLYNRVGDLYVRLGKPMDAVTYYEQAADRYADAGLFNNAIALCNKALRYEPGRLPLLKKLGAFSASQGFFTDARRWYLEFAEKSFKRGGVDDAFSALSDLANISDDTDIRELLARQLREYGRDAEAIQEFKRLHAMHVANGQQDEANSIAAELKLLDPGVDLSSAQAPRHAPHTYEWQHTEQLPGFVDVEPPAVETISEPEPEFEPEPEPALELSAEPESEPALEAIAPAQVEEPEAETEELPELVDLPELEDEAEQVDLPELEDEAEQVDLPELEDEAEQVGLPELDDLDELDDLPELPELVELPELAELPELVDLQEMSFGDFAEPAAATNEAVGAVRPEDPLDLGPLELEVEEEHALFDLSSFHVEPETADEPRERVDTFSEFDDFAIEMDEPELELDLDLELPAIDLGEISEPVHELEVIEGLEQYDADLPPLPTFGSPDARSISSFDEAEFGDYRPEPPPRVFDFDEDAEEDIEEEDEFGPEGGFEFAQDVEAAFDQAISQLDEEAVEPIVDEDISADLEQEVEPEAEQPQELAFGTEAEIAFEREAESEHEDVELASPSEHDFEVAAEFDEAAELQIGAAAEAEADLQEVSEPVEAIESLEAGEPLADENSVTVSEPDGFGEPPISLHAPSPMPVADAAPPPPRRPATDYVDLAALFDETDEDEPEESTRFVVAEMPPTGDEEKDFADMLKQFKEKVAQSIPKDDAGSHYDLGIAFKEMGLIDEAIGEFQTALRSGQDRLKVYEELGSCFILKQQYSIAITVLNRAQQMPHADDTELLGVYYNLGRAHEELGQKAEAKAAFERIVAVDIGFQDTTQRLARL